MNITINCDQTTCTFNKKEEHLHPNKHDIMYYVCTHPSPMLQTTFGKDISSETRVCHSKDRRADIIKVSPCSTCICPEPEYCMNCCSLDLKHKNDE